MHSQTGFMLEASLEELREMVDKYKDLPGTTISVLQDIQEHFGYLPEDAVMWTADRLGIPRSKFFGVSTFYSQFSLTPRGKNVVTVCCGTACHVKGSEKVSSRARTDLGLAEGQTTTEDMQFTLELVACLGTCSMAPVAIINDKMYGEVRADKLAREIKKLVKES